MGGSQNHRPILVKTRCPGLQCRGRSHGTMIARRSNGPSSPRTTGFHRSCHCSRASPSVFTATNRTRCGQGSQGCCRQQALSPFDASHFAKVSKCCSPASRAELWPRIFFDGRLPAAFSPSTRDVERSSCRIQYHDVRRSTIMVCLQGRLSMFRICSTRARKRLYHPHDLVLPRNLLCRY